MTATDRSARPLRIVLADGHALVRAGIRSLLEALPSVRVVGEAGNGSECLDVVASLKPDVVLLDVVVPGLGGIEAAAELRRRFPSIRVLILSMYPHPEYARRAVEAGASGYLLKDATPIELELALQALERGETYWSSTISRPAAGGRGGGRGIEGAPEVLTPRQREILLLIVEGRTTKEIAGLLRLSPKTVETHRGHLMERLGIDNVAGLVRYAIRSGLVPPVE